MTILHWFRVDLRTHDNTALLAASRESKGRVVGLYVISPSDWNRHDEAPVKIRFILRGLRELSNELAKLNIPLLIRTAPSMSDVPVVVAQVAEQVGASLVYANRQYELNEVARDESVSYELDCGAKYFVTFHDQTVIPPAELRTGEDSAYTVFSPYKRRWLTALAERRGVVVGDQPPKQERIVMATTPPDEPPTEVAGFKSEVPDDLWPAGEREAERRLNDFVHARMRSYKERRDLPAVDGTSALSPYLACGFISARQCLARAMRANQNVASGGDIGADTWISELIWREFYKSVLVNFPRVCMGRAFKPETEQIVWSDREDHFEAWTQGRTGIPIVDAAMRALLATGWMHNRLRMIAAMYLTKDLFIDWRKGERWFMQHLIDGDLSQNNGGWQWSASTGTDAAPYFRIFNPVLQSQKFDPDGAFIRRWVPELRDVEGDGIHDPSELPMLLRMRLDYHQPLVDRTSVKDRVLAAFKRSE
ncbi:MAG: deoxyribodipyrimidine photo-lyase [Phycisphaerales bacterium]|nr:deoxyribodipyrimidine photo-lyase [Phycisphaerales bacterium]